MTGHQPAPRPVAGHRTDSDVSKAGAPHAHSGPIYQVPLALLPMNVLLRATRRGKAAAIRREPRKLHAMQVRLRGRIDAEYA
jgi:hypothetical protein